MRRADTETRDRAERTSAPPQASVKTVQFSRTAELTWEGTVMRGSGHVRAHSAAFDVPVRFPSVASDPDGVTTPEELLAASHATCYGIGVRSVLARRGGSAEKVVVTATITAEKGSEGIRIRRSHLEAVLEGLAGIDENALAEVGVIVERECTISTAIRGSVAITHDIRTR